jgi:hypothetical protein
MPSNGRPLEEDETRRRYVLTLFYVKDRQRTLCGSMKKQITQSAEKSCQMDANLYTSEVVEEATQTSPSPKKSLLHRSQQN